MNHQTVIEQVSNNIREFFKDVLVKKYEDTYNLEVDDKLLEIENIETDEEEQEN